jgi:putative MATE family efflux protein
LQKFTERLGSAPLPSLLVRLSIPGISAMVATSVYNIVDTFWVARLGHEAIAALTIVFPYQILAIAVGIGTGVGISALVSRRFGEKNIEATNHLAGQIFFLSLFWGLLFMYIALIHSERILIAFGATPDIMDFGTSYLVITAFGSPAFIFALIASNLIRGSGDPVKPMIIIISSSLINIVLDPFLIMGIGPFPEMGIRGAALATVIAQSFGAVLALVYLLGRLTTYRVRLRHLPPRWYLLKDIYRVGTPASIQEMTESLSFVIFNRLVSGFGSVAIAAVGLTLRVADLFFMPIIGVSQALIPIVGFNFGAGNAKRLWRAVKLSSVGLMIMLGFFTVFVEIFSPQITGLFSQDPEVLRTTVPAMRIMLSTLIFIGPGVMAVATFQGLSKGGMALFLSLIRQFLVFVPLVFLLRHLFGLTGIWFALPASDVISFVVSTSFLYREYRRQQKEFPSSGRE